MPLGSVHESDQRPGENGQYFTSEAGVAFIPWVTRALLGWTGLIPTLEERIAASHRRLEQQKAQSATPKSLGQGH